jgi:xanthine dehydrogenase YagR molybdenum-binding subunit
LVDAGGSQSCAPSDLPILQDDRIAWNGQPVCVVVADTLEQAQYAASLGSSSTTPASRRISRSTGSSGRGESCPNDILGEPPEVTVGDPDAALASAAVRVDHLYRTPW